jgi:uncharacterized protein
MNYQAVIDKYYPEENELKNIFIVHSKKVTEKCLRIIKAHPELPVDATFVEEAAMLHDLGIFLTDAPGIHCHGTEPYLCHGVLGAELLRKEGYPRHARVCERHTGAGLTCEEIERRNLPLPHRDLLPETLEEQLICYADKFFSKTHPEVEKSAEKALRSLEPFGAAGCERFKSWMKQFGEAE